METKLEEMIPDLNFENVAQEEYEKRKQKEFKTFDKSTDCKDFERYMKVNLIGIVLFSFVLVFALLLLFGRPVFEWLDGLNPGVVTVFTLLVIIGLILGIRIVKSAKKSW